MGGFRVSLRPAVVTDFFSLLNVLYRGWRGGGSSKVNLVLLELVVFIYLFIYMCMINWETAVRIQLKIGRNDIQVSKSNLNVSFVQTPLFNRSN